MPDLGAELRQERTWCEMSSRSLTLSDLRDLENERCRKGCHNFKGHSDSDSVLSRFGTGCSWLSVDFRFLPRALTEKAKSRTANEGKPRNNVVHLNRRVNSVVRDKLGSCNKGFRLQHSVSNELFEERANLTSLHHTSWEFRSWKYAVSFPVLNGSV